MNFGLGGAQAQGGGGGGGAQAREGPPLESIETEQLGFQGVSKDYRLRLLATPWPAESLPPPTASLLSIASSKGLVAAAGPEALVLARTETVRTALRDGPLENGIRTYTPEATIPIPRVSHVAFSSNEGCLVIAAEQGGGLAIYDTNALVKGGNEPAFQLATDGKGVRQLLPNPNPSSETAHLFGIVLEEGQLLLADLKKREMIKTDAGSAVFHTNVTCACWSKMGKQIVAGRTDGTCAQIDQQGNVKAEIPRPPQLQDGAPHAVSSIYWLETNEFLVIHSVPDSREADMGMSASAEPICHLARREKPNSTEWMFQTIVNPCLAGFSGGRSPACHFVQRLKDWPPNLDDLLLMTATTSPDVGVLTKSKAPLGASVGDITGLLTTTAPIDTRRAGLPMSLADGSTDTSPIGMAMDLSATEKITRPLPNDETLDQSPVPLPALYVLNNEGLLSIWWIVYNESVKNGVTFPDLIAAGGPRSLDSKKETTPSIIASASPSSTSTFGMALPQPPASRPAFGAPAFGAPSTPGFGGASSLGNRQSPWATSAPTTSVVAAGRPAFGSATPLASGGGFGQVGALSANKPSVWGTQSSETSYQIGKSTFGQPSAPFGGNASAQSPFMNIAPQNKTDGNKSTSIFGGGQSTQSFGGLGAAAGKEGTFGKPSLPGIPSFGKPSVPGTSSFGSTATTGSGSFPSAGTFGQPSTAFNTPSQNATGLFGRQAQSREETMDDDEEDTPSRQRVEDFSVSAPAISKSPPRSRVTARPRRRSAMCQPWGWHVRCRLPG